MALKKYFDSSFLILLALTFSCLMFGKTIFQLNAFWMLQIILWLQFVLVLLLSAESTPQPKVIWLFTFYIASRLFLFQSDPILEDDYFRYLWDGRLLSEGVNPYLLPPSDPFWKNVSSAWREHINFPDISTIYPPLAQLYFSLIYVIFGESVFGLRSGAMIVEIGLSALILKYLKKENLNLKPLAIFLFFPTLMKENINSVHFDLLATFFIFGCFLLLKKVTQTVFINLLAWVTLACAVLVKVFPILFVPVIFFNTKNRGLGLCVFILCIVCAYLPFSDAGLNLFGGSIAFAKNWLFFESTAYYIQRLVIDEKVTRMILAALLASATLYLSFSQKIKLQNKFNCILLSLFLFSTVLNSWYWLWILPFLILFAPRFAWSLPLITTFGYSWFVDTEIYALLHQPIYGLLIIFTIAFLIIKNYSGELRWRN